MNLLDSGFRRNDGKSEFLTFFEIIKIDEFVKSRHPVEKRGPGSAQVTEYPGFSDKSENDGKWRFPTSNEVVEFVAHRMPLAGISQLFTNSSILMISKKVRNSLFPSFRRKPESSKFNYFWMPPYQVRGRLIKSGMTVLGLFTRPSILADF